VTSCELRTTGLIANPIKSKISYSSVGKGRFNPITGLDRPLGLQEIEADEVSNVSPTLRPPLSPSRSGDSPGTLFC
jgi:hypothetical protein